MKRFISEAASSIFSRHFATTPPHLAGDTWLAIRSWVAMPSPRPPIRRYVREAVHDARLSRRGPRTVELRAATPSPEPAHVPWEGVELRIAEGLSLGASYAELGASLGISPSSVARRVAAMREDVQ